MALSNFWNSSALEKHNALAFQMIMHMLLELHMLTWKNLDKVLVARTGYDYLTEYHRCFKNEDTVIICECEV